ncbi:glycosyltransferase family 4 protein [Mucilaginibacter celer]|uniref:Glycosyltransferase n=1 Tax=Mucilaginibacter celer TaxID=2305508 RepID=A0A494VP29_9SPHI|nr:glycosyltransferase family 4 protein [Mucilaginibacter celer]AYL95999.1 glycosyltransferase [Mucilaginibacter celer]
MNILYLCDEYPPGRHGGIGTYVRLIARQMAKLGHKVIVAGMYSTGYGGDSEFIDEGVKVYRFRWKSDGTWADDRQLLLSKLTNRILRDTGVIENHIKQSLISYEAKLEQLITDEQIDIVEMPDYNDYIRFCKSYVPFPQLSVPVVVKMNGTITYFDNEAGLPTGAHIVKMEQAILNQASAVSSASRYTAEKSAGYLNYDKPITVLYNGINTDLKLAEILRNPLQVVFTGSLVQKKGIYQLAKAWNIVNKNIPDARLLILGKGPQKAVADYLSDGVKSSVTFKGHVPADELYGILSSSAIAVFPSYAEAFALAPLEAMACGAAVINSNRTSGPELVEGSINGLLVDPDNINQLAEAILLLLKDAELCTRLGKAGNEKVKAFFDINIIAKQTLEFYEGVLSNA